MFFYNSILFFESLSMNIFFQIKNYSFLVFKHVFVQINELSINGEVNKFSKNCELTSDAVFYYFLRFGQRTFFFYHKTSVPS